MTSVAISPYSVLDESRRVFEDLLDDPRLSIPKETKALASKVQFLGTSQPGLPVVWKFGEAINALKALEATIANRLFSTKFKTEPQDIVIDSDHAALFITSPFVLSVDGQPVGFRGSKELQKYLKNRDYNRFLTPLYRALTSNIYKTKDEKFFHTHNNFNPDLTQNMIGIPHDSDLTDRDEIIPIIQAKVKEQSAAELQYKASEVYKQAGTICYTTKEFEETLHGNANANSGIYELSRRPGVENHPAAWWDEPENEEPNIERPLRGLKVLDLSRVIAAPTVGRTLSEYGATVLRITGPQVPDFWPVLPDLNNGKYTAELDLKKDDDKKILKGLIANADVIIDGYRPGVMEKLGFGRDRAFEIVAKARPGGRGLVYVRENTYGWHGPWQGLSGWQSISDAVTGVSWETGRAMGYEGPVTPFFPNSDFGTGVAGTAGVLHALQLRGTEGGNYNVDIALNYYNTWLVKTVGKYDAEVWNALWSRHEKMTFKHYDDMKKTTSIVVESMKKHSPWFFKESYFEERQGPLGNVKYLAPVVKMSQTKNKWDIPTRDNGHDQPIWPKV